MIADLKKYDQKYVLIKDIYGETHIGLARYENADFLECEWGGEGDGLFIEDFLIYNDQIASIEETVVHGTAELWTEQLILRKARPEDAGELHHYLGRDPEFSRYSGWNPYATEQMAEETVNLLFDMIQKKAKPKNIIMPAQLLIKESSGTGYRG